MVDQPAATHAVVVDGLGDVAVGVEQEPAVVVVAMLRTRARLASSRYAAAVPARQSGQHRVVEALGRFAVGRAQGHPVEHGYAVASRTCQTAWWRLIE
jgi:hypothetical protein